MGKNAKDLRPLFAIFAAAGILGIGYPFFAAVSFDAACINAWGTVCTLFAVGVLSVCFRIRPDAGLVLGFGTGLILMLSLYCLKQGGFGIFCLAVLPLLWLGELIFFDKTLRSRDLTAILLGLAGFLLLCGNLKVTLFPFAIALQLKKDTVFWQLAFAVLMGGYLLLCQKCASVSSTASRAAGQLLGCFVCFAVSWYMESQFAFPLPDCKQLVLLIWCAVMIALVALPLSVYASANAKAVQNGCALLLCCPIARLTQSFLSHTPFDFNLALGSALAMAAVLTAKAPERRPKTHKKE